MREDIQMRNAVELAGSYSGKTPLQQHINIFYRNNKNIGGRDRKFLTELIYSFFRWKGNNDIEFIEDGMLLASSSNPALIDFHNYWKNKIGDLANKNVYSDEKYFPLNEKISPQIDKDAFMHYLHNKPKIFIRIDPEFKTEITEELNKLNFEFSVDGNIIVFEKNYALDTLETFEAGLFEIQDIASQRVSELFQPKKNESWWDCCAGSGGKSLMLLDKQPQLQIFVSDTRESILSNLRERFERHDIINYNSYVIDLENVTEKELNKLPLFNNIIADVPCSGSGTWGRTPEWLTYFNEELLENYIKKQRAMVSAIFNNLLPGGKIIFITCSVYASENENNVSWFLENLPLKLVEQKYFQYSEVGGDTMFGAVLIK